MKNSPVAEVTPRVVLCAATAADLMTPNPVWIRPDATVKEAAKFLAEKRVSAAPVIDEAGRPLGVLSQSDIVAHCREMVEFLTPGPEYYRRVDLRHDSAREFPTRCQVVDVDRTPVRDIMFPTVYSVTPETPAHQVIQDMVSRRVHRIFVVSDHGILVGIISTVDVLHHLQKETYAPGRQRAPL
jgi:CBS-domain-containing membrane protein